MVYLTNERGNPMRSIAYGQVVQAVQDLCIEANCNLGTDLLQAFERAKAEEKSATGKEIMDQLIENASIAASDQVPLCQDTGFAVFFVELGQQVQISGGLLTDAINEGVRRGYSEGFLRKSIVNHPFDRVNTGDNTPAVIHLSLVEGDQLKITFAPKGGGSENMSGLKMLKPADGLEGVKQYVLTQVEAAGPNPCPPIIVGVGIGGTFEKCATLAKEALLRPVGQPHSDPQIAALESELLKDINKLGIGPQGLGGTTTALAVHIEIFPCHIASLPVAVNINCHSSRHKEIIL